MINGCRADSSGGGQTVFSNAAYKMWYENKCLSNSLRTWIPTPILIDVLPWRLLQWFLMQQVSDDARHGLYRTRFSCDFVLNVVKCKTLKPQPHLRGGTLPHDFYIVRKQHYCFIEMQSCTYDRLACSNRTELVTAAQKEILQPYPHLQWPWDDIG